MKKLFTAASLILALAAGAYAQESGKKIGFGLGLEAALPPNASFVGGAGLTARITYTLDEKMAITGTSGAIAFIPKKVTGIDMKPQINIPIKAGFRYMLTSKVYGLLESGYTITKVYYVNPGTGKVMSASGSSFTYAPGVGVKFGGLDLGLRYEGYTGGGFLGLRLGYDF